MQKKICKQQFLYCVGGFRIHDCTVWLLVKSTNKKTELKLFTLEKVLKCSLNMHCRLPLFQDSPKIYRFCLVYNLCNITSCFENTYRICRRWLMCGDGQMWFSNNENITNKSNWHLLRHLNSWLSVNPHLKWP